MKFLGEIPHSCPHGSRPPSARPTTGNENQFSSYQSGAAHTTGRRNQFEGCKSGFRNTTGGKNSFFWPHQRLKQRAGHRHQAPGNTPGPAGGGLRDPTAFGFFFTVNVSNHIRPGNTAVTVMEGQGFSNPSDARFKHRVRAHVPGSALPAASC